MTDFTKLVDLASERLGGRAIAANDEFFAPKSNMLKASKPIFIEGKFTSRGKWMDGWETRRRRTPGYDWCVIRPGLPGIVRGVIVDTSHFKGNYPARFSLEGLELAGSSVSRTNETRWRRRKLLDGTPRRNGALAGDSQNEFAVRIDASLHPLAAQDLSRRWRGAPAASTVKWCRTAPGPRQSEVDLASIINGGRDFESSDEFLEFP